MSNNNKNILYCSFCGKSQHEVRKLIAGPTVFICDECVELCMDIIKEESKDTLVKHQDGLPPPKEICTVLDDYVLAGSNDGYLRAFDTETGAVLWEFDTTQSVDAVGDRIARGGSVGGGQAPIVVGDRIILNSGYAFSGKMPGNALLVLKARPQ